jgi:hypothetical protein
MHADSAKQSTLDFQELLRQLPMGVLACDDQERLVWMNPWLERMLGISASEVLGRTWEQLPLVPASPAGPRRRFRLTGARSSGPQMVDCSTRSVLVGDTLMQVSCFTPVQMTSPPPSTGKPVLRLLPGNRSARDSGMLEESAIESVLQAEVSRSRRYHNPLSVVLVLVISGSLREVGKLLRDQVRWADLIGRRESGELLLMLPETDAIAAAQLVRKLQAVLASDVVNGGEPDGPSLQFGVAEWRRGDNTSLLLERARGDLLGRHPPPG